MAAKKYHGTPFHVWNQDTDMEWFMKYFGIGPEVIVRGEGAYLYNPRGTHYINGISSMWNVAAGLGHEQLVEAACVQMRELAFSGNWSMVHLPVIKLAAKLVEITAGYYQQVLFGSNGSDAVEAALKMARQYHRQSPDAADRGRYKIIALRGAYHGFSYGCLSAAGNASSEEKFGPLAPGFAQIEPPYCYRCPFGDVAYPECGVACAQALDAAIQAEGPESVAGFILEPVMGNFGVVRGPDEYYARVGEICHRYGLLLIADEVTTGFGRTGQLFASQDWNPRPDILIIGKAITNGYFPLSATLATQRVYERFLGKDQYFSHGVTHGGHPVGCAIALAAIDILLSEGLPENSTRVGGYLKSRLEALMPDRPQLGDVRGYGLMLGFELVQDRQSKAPLNAASAADIALDIDVGGLLMARMGVNFILMPPLIIDEAIADEMVRIIDRGLDRSLSRQARKKTYLLKELMLAKLFP